MVGRVCEKPGELVVIDPLQYPGWDSLVAAACGGSFFHGTAWARVLRDTYGHRAFYLCDIVDGRLEEMLPIMEVCSRWTGRRGVSLPFTDWCSAIERKGCNSGRLFESGIRCGRDRRWRYLEYRKLSVQWPAASPSVAFYGHRIDLQPTQAALFKQLDSSVRRCIRKGQVSGVRIEFGSGLEAMRVFYGLHCKTRRRHGLPPQPLGFFDNIARHVVSKGAGSLLIARAANRPVAAAVFFHHGAEAIYKFAASDYAFQHLRANTLLLWTAIKHYAANGFLCLDLGRTSLANEGLRRFKAGFGARQRFIEYCRYDFSKGAFVKTYDRSESPINRLFRCLPGPLLRLAGEMLYPHLA